MILLYVPGISRTACQCGNCILDKAERLQRQEANNARGMYVCINPRSQQWQNIASARFIESISVEIHQRNTMILLVLRRNYSTCKTLQHVSMYVRLFTMTSEKCPFFFGGGELMKWRQKYVNY